MVGRDQIVELAQRIGREFRPERVILFGSYAYGSPRDDSDVDLLVILAHQGSGLRKSVEILKRVRPTFGVDLLVRTPQQLHQRLAWNDQLLHEAVDRGAILYAAPDH